MLKFGLAAVALAAAIAAANHYDVLGYAESEAPSYRLATVTRGPIASTVSASGKLRAVVTVEVGTQVSGLIKTLHADFNSEVEAGQVIARIDSAPFEAKLSQAEAERAVAEASVAMEQASLRELQAELVGHRAGLTEAESELKRQKWLLSKGAAPDSAVETATAIRDQADSRINAGLARLANQKAKIELVRAQVLEKAAAVQQRQLDLDSTYIRSPVDGVIINRNVDAGQTVASSLEAPVLFMIAQDLSQMQVNISVDEADIGRIRVGQKVTFTVDTFANRTFEGSVHQIRKAAWEYANVVTYTVVASTDNTDQSLLPGMTATASIIIEEHDGALRIPLTAFYFHPEGAEPGYGKRIWTLDAAGVAQPVAVTVGITDSVEIEILGGDLVAGQPVIIGVAEAPAGARRKWFQLGF